MWIRISAGLMALSVGLGAFAAHALKPVLGTYESQIWQTATQYLTWHALGLLALSMMMHFPEKFATSTLRLSATMMLVGVLVFSGSLYALALSGVKIWGMVTPVGGVLLILAWLNVVRVGKA